jgi:hypothetical protein
MPESVRDRPTRSHEYIFLLAKQRDYYYDADAIREPAHNWGARDPKLKHYGLEDGDFESRGRNKRSVWTVTTKPYKGAHFATFPPDLIEPCIKAGSSEKGVCPECGKPWERVVEKVKGEPIEIYNGQATKDYADANAQNPSDTKRRILEAMRTKSTTIGWQPTCEHKDLEPRQAIVFDPFMGSGTTAWVARKLGRSAVGLDLSYDYLHDQARKRLGMDVPSLL